MFKIKYKVKCMFFVRKSQIDALNRYIYIDTFFSLMSYPGSLYLIHNYSHGTNACHACQIRERARFSIALVVVRGPLCTLNRYDICIQLRNDYRHRERDNAVRQEGRERIVIRVVLRSISRFHWLDFHDEFLSRER